MAALTEQQVYAEQIILEGHNVVLTGQAGTEKSFLLQGVAAMLKFRDTACITVYYWYCLLAIFWCQDCPQVIHDAVRSIMKFELQTNLPTTKMTVQNDPVKTEAGQLILFLSWPGSQPDLGSAWPGQLGWRKLGPLATHWVHSKDSDQTGRMPRLIWVFAGCTLILLVLSCRGSYTKIRYCV